MPVEAYTLFGELKADTNAFKGSLREAENRLLATELAISNTEKKAWGLGDTTATTGRKFARLSERVEEQRSKMLAAAKAFERGDISARQLAGAFAAVDRAGAAVVSRLKDIDARIHDVSKQKLNVAAASKPAGVTPQDRMAHQAALQQQRIDAQTAMQKQRLAQQASQFQIRAQQAANRANQQLAIAQQRIAAQTAAQQQRLAQQASQFQIRMSEQAARRFEAAQRRQQAAAEKAARASAMSWEKFRRKMDELGSGLSDIGRSMTVGVTAPIAALGAISVRAADGVFTLRNKLFAATGSMDTANSKIEEYIQLARENVGVTADLAAENYAFFKILGVGEERINNLLVALGKVRTLAPDLPIEQFRTNLTQLFNENFEIKDMREMLSRAPVLGKLMAEKFGAEGPDPSSLQKAFKRMKASGALTFESFLEGFADAVNSDDAISKLQDNFFTRLAKLALPVQKALEPVGNALIAILEPAINKGAQILGKLGQAFAGLGPWMQTAMIAAAGVAAALGPVLVVMGKVATAVAALGGMAALAPLMAKIAAGAAALAVALAPAAAAAAALYMAWDQNFGGIRTITTNVFQGVAGIIGTAVQKVNEIGGRAVGWWRENWPQIQAVVEQVSERVKAGIETWVMTVNSIVGTVGGRAVAWWRQNWPIIADIARQTGERLVSTVRSTIEAVDGFWSRHGESIMRTARTAWEGISKLFDLVMTNIGNVARVGLQIVQGDWDGAFRSMLDTIRDATAGMLSHMRVLGRGLVEAIWAATPILIEIIGRLGIWLQLTVGKLVVKLLYLIGTLPAQIPVLVPKFMAAGKALTDALWEGIKSGLSGGLLGSSPDVNISNPFENLVRDLAFGVPDFSKAQTQWEEYLKNSQEVNRRRVEDAQKAAAAETKAIEAAAQKAAEARKRLMPDFRDLVTGAAEAITQNPLVKFFNSAEKAAEDAYKKFEEIGPGFARMAAQIARSAERARFVREAFDTRMRGFDARQEAARLGALPATQTNGFQRILGALEQALGFIKDAARSTAAANRDRLLARGGVFMDESILQLRSTVSQLQEFDSTARRFDDIAKKLGGDLGEFGKLALAQAKLDILPSSEDLAQLMRAGNVLGRIGLNERASLQDQLAAGRDGRLRDLLENQKFAELARRQAREAVDFVNLDLARLNAKDRQAAFPQALEKILAITSSLGPGELTPDLRAAQMDALLKKAVIDENREQEANKLVKQLIGMLGPDGAGVPIRIKDGRHIVEINDRSNGAAEVRSTSGGDSDVNKRYGQR